MSGAIPYLDGDAVAQATPMPALIEAMRAAFADSDYSAPPRLNAAMGAVASLLVMPAWHEAGPVGVKIVRVDPERRPSIRSTYLLIDPEHERPVAVIDGAMLTRRRTAAASVLAATYLARPQARTLLLIGTGALIAPLIEAYRSAFALEQILVWGRDPAKAERVAAEARLEGCPVDTTTDLPTAVAQADIVSSATLAQSPLIQGHRLAPGTHVDLIGAFRPDMAEADGPTFARSRVFVDTFEGAMDEAGDLLQAIDAGCLTRVAIEGDLAALVSGRHGGRGNDEPAITLFKSVGTAIEDLAAAQLVRASVAEP